MNVQDLINAMEQIAPARFAEPWDNVGLICGDASTELRSVVLCIDLTAEVLEEAKRLRAKAVIAYHPPIFKGLKQITAGGESAVVFECLRSGISIYTPHTALDVAAGGTCDVLADAVYLTERHPLRRSAPSDAAMKLVTFVPTEAVVSVTDALSAAGAGVIGDYTRCTFRTPGTGTFLGGEESNPAVGEAGRLETVAEVRLETVVPKGRLGEVVAALRKAHPYEEPAFDIYPRVAPPSPLGLGRIGDFEEPVPREVLIGRVRRELQLDRVLVAGRVDGDVRRVAVCPGSCGDLLDDAARQGAEFYLTGEMKHHDALRAVRLGLTVVCVLHSNSERATLERLRRRLSDMLPGCECHVSETDRDPFSIL